MKKSRFPSARRFSAEMKAHDITMIREYREARQRGELLNYPATPIQFYGMKWSELVPASPGQGGKGMARATGQSRPGAPKRPQFPLLKEFQAALRKHGISSGREYLAAIDAGLLENFPKNPAGVYGRRWSELSGGRTRLTTVPPVEKLRRRLAEAKIYTWEHYREVRDERFPEFPADPAVTYRLRWRQIAPPKPAKVYPPLEDLLEIILRLKLRRQQYREERLKGRFREFPSEPTEYYGFSWPRFPRRSYPSRTAFIRQMRRDGVHSQLQYVRARSAGKYQAFPGHPNAIYRCSWAALFGNEATRPKKDFWPIQRARNWVIRNRIRTRIDFMNASKPKGVPSAPHIVYEAEFDHLGGWKWFLGQN